MFIVIIFLVLANFFAGIAIILALDDRDQNFYKWVMTAPFPIKSSSAFLVASIWPFVGLALYCKNFSGFSKK